MLGLSLQAQVFRYGSGRGTDTRTQHSDSHPAYDIGLCVFHIGQDKMIAMTIHIFGTPFEVEIP
jgi:hypothetical protein